MYNPFSTFPQQNLAAQYQQMYQRPQMQMPPKIGVIEVSGRAGADALQMAPNDKALLLDVTAPIVWLAQTDGAGYKTLAPYKIEPYQPAQPVDTTALEARVQRLEEMMHGKSDFTGNGDGSSATGGNSPTTA